ncbi:MAG: toxin [Candidatus Omnitrophota bacterium]
MKELRWDLLKSERLKRTRGASFEEMIQSKLIAVKRHPKRTGQNIMLFEHRGYIWVVPFVETENEIFLKTLYPSRNYTKLYKRGELS